MLFSEAKSPMRVTNVHACTCPSRHLHLQLWRSDLTSRLMSEKGKKHTQKKTRMDQECTSSDSLCSMSSHLLLLLFQPALFTAHSESRREKEGSKERTGASRKESGATESLKTSEEARASERAQEAVFYEAGCSQTCSSALESQSSRVSSLCVWRIVSDKLSRCLSNSAVVSLPIRKITPKRCAWWCQGLLGLPKWEPCLWSRQTVIKRWHFCKDIRHEFKLVSAFYTGRILANVVVIYYI